MTKKDIVKKTSAKLKKNKHYRPAGKKKEGNAARYMTRSQAIKQLQVNLNVFRKLCILKGVFPREPKKKVRGNNQTYYHVKDIAFIQHEPLLEKLREQRAYERKVQKALAKKNKDLATRLRTREPTYTLDRLVRERYPKFIDALRDLDDCLSMVHLFAALPAEDRLKIDVARVHSCRRLTHEWQAYVARCHKLRKVFISVKGIYYQAEVEGQKITWLTPHAMQQVLPDDVNFTVMLTFVEFYENLLSFVNFKLYHSINVKYPPILDPRLEALAADLYALTRYMNGNSKHIIEEQEDSGSSKPEKTEGQKEGTQFEESELRLSQLQHQLPSNEPGALMHLIEEDTENDDDRDTKDCKKLFKNMKFYLSREVPRESLLFVIPAFGGVVSWEGDGAPFAEDDQSITHQIVDRPTQGHKFFSREYVQPQWIYDCVNARIILPTDIYMVGRVLPPHLSPFVDNEAEGYTPDYAETIKHLQAAAKNEVLPMPGVGKDDFEDPQMLLAEGYLSRTEANEAAKRKEKLAALEKQYYEELKIELQGSLDAPSVSKKTDDSSVEAKEASRDANQQVAKDHDDMSTMMISRNKRGLYKAIQIGEDRKKAKVNMLKERKKKQAQSSS
ncbi:Pescadillo homolog [Linum perenne]